MVLAHSLGFPRIGRRRELKNALEAYWSGVADRASLEVVGRELRHRAWQVQADAGMDLVPVGDFSYYDHVLDTSVMLGAIPDRFDPGPGDVGLDTMFRMARGRAPTGRDTEPCEMTKWFDTNYHFIVPELRRDQEFRLASSRLFEMVDEARGRGFPVKPVVLGPLSFLWLAKVREDPAFDRLCLLPRLLPVYVEVLERLRRQGAGWVQVEEPILVLDLPESWRAAFPVAYEALGGAGPKVMLATYFGGLGDNIEVACGLPVGGLHVDVVRAPEQLGAVLSSLPEERVLSLGVVDGRNVWRTDLDEVRLRLNAVRERREVFWIAPSCSLLHVPMDLQAERDLDPELRSWLAFGIEKLGELSVLKRAMNEGLHAVSGELSASRSAIASRRRSARLHDPAVRSRVASVDDSMTRRAHPYEIRHVAQQARLRLPDFPTTTIGSFPQTRELRAARHDARTGKLDEAQYEARIRDEVLRVVRTQEELGLDVLVHGEPERNDMVQYFAEQMAGFAVTANGWVQSYGSRCVKPPILFGDVTRPAPMTVAWARHAQSLTTRPVKGMLTGPVTMLGWSFVRNDQPRAETALQVALALRDEVRDLEEAGIAVIQIDEPAFRECLPLRRRDRPAYLEWATRAFRVASSVVRDDTQIHTHMCYSDFNDIIESIAALDADVISIEASRSGMELLDAFADFRYPNEIGPGVYDVHSPRVPTEEEVRALIAKAATRIAPDRLWVNPDCGLKTREWTEVLQALANMVAAARAMRSATGNG